MNENIRSLSTELLNRQNVREAHARAKKILALRDGQWLHTEFSAKGKEPDDEMMRLTRSVVNGAYHTAAVTAVYTPLAFWYVDDDMLEDFRVKIKEFEDSAEIYNSLAINNKSERRLLVKHYLFPVNVEDEGLALRLGQHVRATLLEMKEAILTKDRKGFELANDRARNIHMLAIGEQSEAIEAAVDELRKLKKRMLGMIKSGKDQALTFPRTDRAVEMFMPLD